MTILQIVAIAVGGVAALIVMAVIVYMVYRRFCRSKKRQKQNRIGVESDIISVSDIMPPNTERKNTESFHENEKNETDKSEAPIPR